MEEASLRVGAAGPRPAHSKIRQAASHPVEAAAPRKNHEKPLEEVVERVKLGVDGGLAPVDPRADDLAKEWRRRMTMVAKTEDQEEEVAITKKETLEEVFEVMIAPSGQASST